MNTNTYLFKTSNNNRRIKYESQFFIKKIIKNEMEFFDKNLLFDDTLWKYIELFQNNNLDQCIDNYNLIKKAFLILSNLLIKKFPSLISLSSVELFILISLGKDITLTASEIPDTIIFVKNSKNFKNLKKITLLL